MPTGQPPSTPTPGPLLATSRQTATTQTGIPVLVTLEARDSISDATITFFIVSQPEHGTVVLSGSGVIYTPTLLFSGIDIFGFMATDDHGQTSNVSSVTITVSSTPTTAQPPVVWTAHAVPVWQNEGSGPTFK
jgi:hypothetical protein